MSTKIITKFYGGMTRDEKSKSIGVCSNIEEFDIFENANDHLFGSEGGFWMVKEPHMAALHLVHFSAC